VTTCTLSDCDRDLYARGLCHLCWRKLRRVEKGLPTKGDADALLAAAEAARTPDPEPVVSPLRARGCRCPYREPVDVDGVAFCDWCGEVIL
jgi:hypothetical protein